MTAMAQRGVDTFHNPARRRAHGIRENPRENPVATRPRFVVKIVFYGILLQGS
jgi:hypothetical protein